MITRITTAPGAVEPVDVDTFMAWARVTDENERAACERVITVAREEVERFTNYVLLPGTFRVSGEWASPFALPLTPITAIDSVYAIDGAGQISGIAPADYTSLLTVSPALLYVWGVAPGIEARVSAGYVTPDVPPPALVQAVIDVGVLHYTHRDDPDVMARVHGYLGTLSTTFGIVQV